MMAEFVSKGILIDHVLCRLESAYVRNYGGYKPEYADTIRSASMMAMEIIANTDALYHNLEHTLMVTLVGQEILRGKYLIDGDVSARDWMHVMVSLLCHDIGYVRGICPGDGDGVAIIDGSGQSVEIPAGATDAFLTPYHVERGKLFVMWRFRDHHAIDPSVVAANIENTRFPVPSDADSKDLADFPGLVRAADLIGQLADPDYLRKQAALFHEFKETGVNEKMGYHTIDDVREGYPNFFWQMVSEHIAGGLEYLRVTQEGRQWEAELYSHVFSEEHRHSL